MRYCGAEVRFRSIPEGFNQRMLLERLLDDSALNAFAAPMDESDFMETRFVRGCYVLVYD